VKTALHGRKEGRKGLESYEPDENGRYWNRMREVGGGRYDLTRTFCIAIISSIIMVLKRIGGELGLRTMTYPKMNSNDRLTMPRGFQNHCLWQ
jgi:hypothetical protein